MERLRLVTDQDGKQHVSSVLLTTEEAVEMLELEEKMHSSSGWEVTRYGGTLRCRKGQTVRWVWVRSKPPMEDTL